MRSSILSEVDHTSILRTGLPSRYACPLNWLPASRLAPRAAGWSAATLCRGTSLTLCSAHRTSAMAGRAVILCPPSGGEPVRASQARNQCVEQGLDVAVAIGEGDTGGVAAVDLRDVVGHQHVGVADIAIGGERTGHVDVALVGEGLDEVELLPLDVAEMHVEDLAALAEPADHLEDLAGGVVEHLGDVALTEIEPVIGALVHLHEALQPLDGAEHAGDAAIAGRRVGVVRMAGKPHLGGGRDRDDGAEEMVDPLPVLLLGEDPDRGRGCGLVGARPAESGAARAAAPRLALGLGMSPLWNDGNY